MNWTDKTKDVKTEHKFTPKPTVTHTLPPTATLMDFNPFVPDCFSKHFLSRQTNMPPKSKKLQGEMTNTGQQQLQMKIFLYIQYTFSIHHLPEVDMYWSLDPLLRGPAIADVMGNDKYQKINQYFHIKDNTKALPKTDPNYDPMFKVRPLLDLVKEKSHAHYSPGQEISINEAICILTIFFSSVKLAADLLEKKTQSCSTIHVNREGWPADLCKAKKRMKTGEVYFCQHGETREL